MGWTEIVSALSLGVIAVVVAVCGAVWLRWVHELQGLAQAGERLVQALDRDARPALQSVRSLAEDASGIVKTVKKEVGEYASRSEDLRGRVQRLVEETEDRLRDLETVIDIVQFEVEETALDFAAALRTARRSASILQAMKRAFLGRGR